MGVDFSKYLGEENTKDILIDTKEIGLEEVWRKVSNAIHMSESIRQDISKSIGKEPIEETLLKALKCISLMTGDTVFFESNKDKIGKKD